jgi:DNA replication and repair protein RecF
MIPFIWKRFFCKHEVDQKLRLYHSNQERKILYNSTPLPHVSTLLGLIQGVIMTPDDVNLVKGSPLLRRQFLDTQLAQVDPLYVHYLTRYAKAMRHRNQLLKQKKLLSMESWEYEMAQASAYIVLQRRHHLQALQVHCSAFYRYLTEEAEDLTLVYCSGVASYQTDAEIKEFYLRQFHKNRTREMIIGYTIAGLHKDDIWIGIGGRDARFFASEGQQRSCVAALHMGEWQCLKQVAEDVPLFMMDDVTISLDDQRRSRLLDQLAALGQVFLTTTDVDLVETFAGSKKIFLLPLLPSDSKTE